MTKVQLSIAVGDYDHVRDLLYGQVLMDGVDLVVVKRGPVEEVFHRFTTYREWDISEMSFAKYVALASQPDSDVVAIPVFPSRNFRHSSIYVRGDSPLRSPGQLAGRRLGLPEWAQTAAIYSRGMLVHEYGVPLEAIEWVQAGVNEAGRKEKVALRLPPGVRYRQEPTRSLTEMLVGGELDAALSARPPKAFIDNSGAVRRLFDDPQQTELAYWRKTGVFPIMHVIALRREIFERHPWVAMNLMQAFEEAKRRSLSRIADVTASSVPLPWVANYAQLSREILGDDFWPYGIEPNRATLQAFLQFAWEQGVAHWKMTPEDVFVNTTHTKVRV